MRGTDTKEAGAYHALELFNEIEDGIAIQNPGGKIIWTNTRLGEIIGKPTATVNETDAVTFITTHFSTGGERDRIFPRFLRTTYANRLSIHNVPCRVLSRGTKITYSSHVMQQGPFSGLRLDTFRKR
jgi:hypothetical protein